MPRGDKLLFFPVAAALLFAAYYFRDWRPEKFHQMSASNVTLGHRGEWVTRPDGRRVCRLAHDLTLYTAIDRGFCTDWQEREPVTAQPVEGWIRSKGAGHQIMIEGRWRP